MSLFNDAINTSKKFLADRLLPEYDPNFRNSQKGENSTLWKDNISNDQLIAAYKGNGIGRKLVNKIASDTFDNWFNVISDNEKLITDVNLIFSSKKRWSNPGDDVRLGLKKTLKEIDKIGMVEGCALLMLGYSDDGGLEEEVINPKSLDYLSIIPRSTVRKLLIEQESGSEHYGEIIGAMVKLGTGPAVKIHASRFIYKPVNQYGNDPEGIGFMRPAYNYLVVLDNVIWSTGQAFYRNAAGFLHFIKKKGKSAAMKAIKTQAKNTNALTAWVSDESTEIKDVGVKKSALNPEPYLNVAVFAVSTSFDIPAQIVIGTAAGAVTGSETNLDDYYSDISSKQDIEQTPTIEELIIILQGTNQIAQGEFNIEWKPLKELDEKKQAETEKIKAETEKIRIEAGIITPEEIRKKLEIETKTDSKADAVIPDFEYDDRTNLDANIVEELAQQYADDIIEVFDSNEIIEVFEKSEVEGIINDDFGDLERDLLLIEQSSNKKVKKIVDRNIDYSWNYGFDQSEAFLNVNIIASEKSAQIRKILKQSNYTFINSLGNDVTKKTLFAVQQGVLAGDSASVIKKEIEKIVDVAKHRADTIARTESHRAMTESIKASYRDSNVVEEVTYITAGDESVRPTHEALNGRIFPLNNTPSELQDPNCRCTIAAYFKKVS